MEWLLFLWQNCDWYTCNMLGDNSPWVCHFSITSEQRELTALCKNVCKATARQVTGWLTFQGIKARVSSPQRQSRERKPVSPFRKRGKFDSWPVIQMIFLCGARVGQVCQQIFIKLEMFLLCDKEPCVHSIHLDSFCIVSMGLAESREQMHTWISCCLLCHE